MKKVFVLLWALFATSLVEASTFSGKIAALSVINTSSLVYVKVDGVVNRSGSTCSTHTGYDYAFLVDTEYGKSVLSTLLAARLADKSVTIAGKGDDVCNALQSNMEDIKYVVL